MLKWLLAAAAAVGICLFSPPSALLFPLCDAQLSDDDESLRNNFARDFLQVPTSVVAAGRTLATLSNCITSMGLVGERRENFTRLELTTSLHLSLSLESAREQFGR